MFLAVTSPDPPLVMHSLTHGQGELEGPRGCCLAREGQSSSEERQWLPPKASGKEKVDKEKAAGWKRCQREGNQSRTGTERSWGAGGQPQRGGVGQDKTPEGQCDRSEGSQGSACPQPG